MVGILGANTLSSGYDIDNSLRFNDGDSPELYKTLGTPTNNKIYTFSMWLKRGVIDTSTTFIGHYDGSASNPFAVVQFQSAGTFRIEAYDDETSSVMNLVTNQLFRDVSAWYHVVLAFDTTQGTASNRVKVYVNGNQVTSFGTETYPAEDKVLAFNKDDTEAYYGVYKYGSSGSGSNFYDGYISELHFIDGQQKAASDFGEFNDNGIWIPKAYTGTYGDNGHYFEFQQTGTSANSSGIGADTSGKDNHFAVTNLAALDVVVDTPTNNFATMNPLDNYHSGFTFSEGNCKFVTADSSAYPTATIGDLKQGKWYFEFKYTDSAGIDGIDAAGEFYGEIGAIGHKLSDGVSVTDTSTDLYASSYEHNFMYAASNGRIKSNSTAGTVHGSQIDADGEIIGFLLDLDNDRVTTHLNGQYADGSGNHDESSPTSYVSITAPASTPLGGYFIGGSETVNAHSGNQHHGTYEINFGNPSFSISSGNADANGYGNFEYAVPSGYYALCTKNLAEFG